jgi:hypothetical protein
MCRRAHGVFGVGAVVWRSFSALYEPETPTVGRLVMEVAAEISETLGYEKWINPEHHEIGVLTVAGLTQELIQKEAQEFYKAEREKTTLRPLTERYPKIEPQEAYQIQLALIEMKKAGGAKVVGKKIGLTSKAMQNIRPTRLRPYLE